MTRLIAVVFIAGISPVVLCAGSEEARAWTLAKAVAQATRASPDALQASARVAAARAMQARADAARLPDLDFRASYLQTNNALQGFGAILNQGVFDDTIDFNAPGQIDAFTAGLHARYALYTGGRATAARRAARAVAEAAEFEREAALDQLALEVVRGYFAIRRFEEALTATEAARANYTEALRVGRLREESGDLLATERLNLEVQLAQTVQQQLAARHALKLGKRRLAFLLGLAPGSSTELAQNDPTPALLELPDGDAPIRRPELLAAQRRLDAAERRERAARGARLPGIEAFANVQTDHGWRKDGEKQSWTAGVAAALPIFDGGGLRAGMRAAAAEVEVAREATRQVELALALEVEEARLDHELAREQLAVTGQEVKLAGESARLSQERFAAGALLSTELIGAETRLAEARMRQASARAGERVAVAAFRRAAGQPIFE